MATVQGEVVVGNVAKMVNRLSKPDLSKSMKEPPQKMSRTPASPLLHIATYAYKSQQSDELNLEVDDVIEVLAKIEDGWNKGRLQRSGFIGMYPTNYCEVYKPKESSLKFGAAKPVKSATNEVVDKTATNFMATDEQPAVMKRLSSVDSSSPVGGSNGGSTNKVSSTVTSFPPASSSSSRPFSSSIHKEEVEKESEKEYAKVVFVYEAQHEDELSLSPVGALVVVTNKQTGDPGWFEGELSGKRGLFPDNFVELVKPSSISGSPSTARLHEKPPAALPGAAAVLPPLPPQDRKFEFLPAFSRIAGAWRSVSWPAPPLHRLLEFSAEQVPAKPPKNVLTTSTPSLSTASAAGQSSSPSRPVTAILPPTNNAGDSSTAAAGDDSAKATPAINSAFKEAKAKIQHLPMFTPGTRPPPPSNSAAASSPTSTAIVVEPAGPSLAAPPETVPLTHLTKGRVRPTGGRRPVSMFPKAPPNQSVSNENMSRSDIGLGIEAPLAASSPKTSPTTAAKESSATAITPSITHSFGRHSEPSPSLPPSAVTGNGIETAGSGVCGRESGECVSRQEYNQLLDRVRCLEERLLSLELSRQTS